MHTTTHREMIMLKNGAILIDTPGMRELGVVDSEEGIELTFSGIVELSKSCRFENCTHINEPDCAILNAVDNGDLSEEEYENYMKMTREAERLRASKLDKRIKDREFGRMVKEVKKFRKKNKY